MRKVARWLLSRAANLTPNVTYYAKSWPMRINNQLAEVASQRGGKSTPMTVAAISLCCAMHEGLRVGDEATIDLTGVTTGGLDVGSFTVTLKRVVA